MQVIQNVMKAIHGKSEQQLQILESLDNNINLMKQAREDKERDMLQMEDDILKIGAKLNY